MFKKREFSRRRTRLMEFMDEKSIAIIPTAPTQRRSRDTFFRFRPDSNFYYLTGFSEPDSVAVLMPGRGTGQYVLFCRERAPLQELWDGSRTGVEGAIHTHGADDAFPYEDIESILPGLLESRKKIFYAMGANPDFDARMIRWMTSLRSRLKHASFSIVSVDDILHEMRLYKSVAEVAAIRRAVETSVHGHRRAMAVCRPGVGEYELEAEFLYECMRRGGGQTAYPTIVASGKNANTYHYTQNKGRLKAGDLVLVDAGVECSYYASDITRTYPVSGRFSEQQRLVYELVVEAQRAAIDCVVPGGRLDDAHAAALAVISSGLTELRIFAKHTTRRDVSQCIGQFVPRRTSHWLGLDVHDVGTQKIDGESRTLEPNMVLTVEPGLYLPHDDVRIKPRWRNLVVRLEDDVLVTKRGAEVLSCSLPSSVDDLEELVGLDAASVGTA